MSGARESSDSAVPPTGSGPTSAIARAVTAADAGLGGLSGGALRVEDALLLGWLLVGGSIDRLLGGPTLPHGPTGLAFMAAVILSLVVVATRSPGDPSISFEGEWTPRSYAPLPFLLSISIVANQGMDDLGLASDWVVGVAFLVTLATYVLAPRLPSLPRTARRLLIVPFILVAGTVFGGMVTDLSGLFDFRPLLGDPTTTPSGFLGQLGLDVLFSGFFYLAFIFAPRMLAESEGSWRAWLARYGLFLLATIVSVTFLGAGQAS